MTATLINAAAVAAGSLLGILGRRWVTPAVKECLFVGIGVFTLVIGMDMALSSQRLLYVAMAVVIGGIIGTKLGIEDRLYRFGEWVKRSGISRHDRFSEGFLTSSVLFCVGAMAILGSLQAGALGSYEILLTKSIMDGSMSIILAAAMGGGVALSALTIVVYQGGLTLAAATIAPYMSELMLSEISGTGGALILMIGLTLIGVKKIKTGDYLPAILIAVALAAWDPLAGLL
ncbi:DUF554 domain-containing protein [Spirochaeta africana]|uniref:Uncharacterized membrane protein, possible Na+ channel or pump n=1 Tax=Spirochaeta africana (strain ATCC 700263 / DSM 8902 / Z-7692) TaxID=889378 RepID=H9ULV4_SPIAZ|nr:DUF554 domain-containing protein [Spirochaeta africana]AFG38497.1 uncharacterized membrane protein, possible Na+ channel or pump [Spirochaeta africana DSM 8902]